uniref:RNA polymerase II elongation factor Ell-like isoform X1 n=1 Tax=Diabrotica virgifera virgifera TaxID=50390 RepID=A0A6P7G7F2_DIAVI
MAALCPGVQYGLSSQQNYGENRDLIFVKLTDSALRAIEDYLKNQNKFYHHKPTIKFLGNENGELSFPSLHHNMGSTSFSFSMSSTADMEGPGGSFECIKQVGSPRGPLEGLGSIPHKIRIHANDDVYEVTRNRMTEAEDKYKNKCTREIKPNQTDIGRKVKVKQSRMSIHPVRREMPSMRDSLLKQPSSQPYQPKPSIAPPPPASAVVHSSTNGHLSNGLGSNHVSSSRPQMNVAKKLSVPEIPRRPPNSPISNRKPQTLTPPGGGSDGGSSGSGQSPTSTLPGSPPLISTTSAANKRPGYHEGSDGFSYKRQRIAHNAPKHHPDPLYHQPVENNSQRRPVTDSRDASNMNPRSRESPSNGNGIGGGGSYGLNGHNVNSLMDVKAKRECSDEEDDVGKRTCDSHFDVIQEKTFVDSRSISPAVKMLQADKWDRDKPPSDRPNGIVNRIPNGVNRSQHQNRPQDVANDRIIDRVSDRVNDRINDRANDRVIDRINDRVNDRLNDRINDRANDRVNDRVNDRINDRVDRVNDRVERVNDRINDRVGDRRANDRVNDRVNDRINDRVDRVNDRVERVNDRINDRVGDRVNERVNDRINDRVHDRINDRVNDRISDRVVNNKYTNVTSSTENRIARVSPDSQTEGLPNGDVDGNFNNESENEEFPDYKK